MCPVMQSWPGGLQEKELLVVGLVGFALFFKFYPFKINCIKVVI